MTITTLDDALAGMRRPQMLAKGASAIGQVLARFYNPHYAAGTPLAWVAPSPGVDGAALTSYANQVGFDNGAADQYVGRLEGSGNVSGALLLCDRLWHNSGLSVTDTNPQAITFPGLPARDHNASTDGEGVYAAMEIVVGMGAGLNVPEITYTNQAGDTGHTASPRVPYAAGASSPSGTFYDFTLAAGDTGVRAITSFVNTVSMTSGSISLVLYRVLARVPLLPQYRDDAVDALTGGFAKMHDDTVPFFLFLAAAASGPTISGQFTQTNG